MKINLIPPALIFYTDKGMTWQAGTARAFLVRIKAEHAGDTGLLAHELMHVKIFWLVTLVSALLIYLTAPLLIFASFHRYTYSDSVPLLCASSKK